MEMSHRVLYGDFCILHDVTRGKHIVNNDRDHFPTIPRRPLYDFLCAFHRILFSSVGIFRCCMLLGRGGNSGAKECLECNQ